MLNRKLDLFQMYKNDLRAKLDQIFLRNTGSVVVRSSQGHLFPPNLGSVVQRSSQGRFCLPSSGSVVQLPPQGRFVFCYAPFLNNCHIWLKNDYLTRLFEK